MRRMGSSDCQYIRVYTLHNSSLIYMQLLQLQLSKSYVHMLPKEGNGAGAANPAKSMVGEGRAHRMLPACCHCAGRQQK